MRKTRRNSVEDCRGDRQIVLPIKSVVKGSGIKRSALATPKDTVSFWKMFFLCGASFAITMILVFVGFSFAMERWLGTDLGRYLLRDWPMQIAIYFVIYGGIIGRVYSRTMWRNPEHGQAAILRAGLCPACVYQIGDIPAESDGCTVCPECGAAWRMGS